jgi:glycosyltransferase involved in cell wall biosynthesis
MTATIQDRGSENGYPVISVCIATYNHEKFIAKALDSVLMQRGNFLLDVLVGEDGSTDNTAAIVRDYAQRHPEIIRAFFHDPADKLFINGRQTGRKNFLNNLREANGDYVALLDGDDYWIDENKLQKQLAHLEAHPSIVACCHAAIHVDEHDRVQDGYMGHHDVKGGQRNFTILDVLQKNPVPALSVLFRNPRLSQFPDFFIKADMADWLLHMLNALRGDIHYVDEKMAAYRLHNAGVWANFRASTEKVWLSEIAVWQLALEEPILAEHVAYIRKLIDEQYSKLVKLALREHAYTKAWQYLRAKVQVGTSWFDPEIIALAFRIIRKQLKFKVLPRKAGAS